ncbi:MAG: hypothetical protein EA369_02250 [Bradymonadales bacterium]|nr:MAG: hypothetical protein EA369_02250 [Bradymonadales bacterium]
MGRIKQNNARPFNDELVALLEKWASWSSRSQVQVSSRANRMAGGRNGPYDDPETPLRNTSHWLALNSILYKISGDTALRDRALWLCEYLLNDKAHLGPNAYVYRQKAGKDSCNGVIGPAWHAEGLGKAGTYLGLNECTTLAKSILARLQFNSLEGAWHRQEAETGQGHVDFTYNHQSWFAAIKAELDGPSPDVSAFLDTSLARSFRTHTTGLASHLFYSNTSRGLRARAIFELGQWKNPKHFETREIGYHLFVMHSLTRLSLVYPDHPLFKSDKFTKAISYIDDERFFESLTTNKYAYPYNSPAYEAPLILLVWRKHFKSLDPDQTIKRLLGYLDEYYSPWSSKPSPQKIPDPVTLFSRVYELAICLEHKFD